MTITEKQRRVVDLLVQAARTGQPVPTYREIARALKTDVRVAYQYIEALEKRGVVERVGGQRGIRLTQEYMPPRGIPVIGRVSAGLPILAEENIDEYIDIRTQTTNDDCFLLKVRGDSMVDRRLFDGDFVLVSPQPRLEQGEIGVVSINGEVTVKEVHVMRDRVILISHNHLRNYPDQVYEKSHDIRIVGKVKMAFRFVN